MHEILEYTGAAVGTWLLCGWTVLAIMRFGSYMNRFLLGSVSFGHGVCFPFIMIAFVVLAYATTAYDVIAGLINKDVTPRRKQE